MPSAQTLSVDEFVAKWRKVSAGETQAAQSHFIDLCAVLGVENPIEADPEGVTYAFEKGVKRPDGTLGQADVRKQDCFGWEYKGKNKDLTAAYVQLLGYREGLGNPPLLVVCDMNRFEVHTNFTNTDPRVIRFDLKDLSQNPTHFTNILRDVFLNPDGLHPNNDPRYITETAAAKFGKVADALRAEDHDPAVVARFLNRIIFCMFAESIGLFRNRRGAKQEPIRDIFENLAYSSEDADEVFSQLFQAMSSESKRTFGAYYIRWFNGGLFDESTAAIETLPISEDLAQILLETSELNWSRINPAIFGTLFERGLNPKSRAPLGAYYTDLDNIMRVIEPVLLHPLRTEFAALKADLTSDPTVAEPPADYAVNGLFDLEDEPPPGSAKARIRAFHERLSQVRVLDPACGSGNFLYSALRALKDLEQEFIEWAVKVDPSPRQRRVGPQNLVGIDINEFAVDLTRMSLWIGHLQWNHEHFTDATREPILGRIDQIECRDAVLATNPRGDPIPAAWPNAEFIIGNPPFLGMKRIRKEFADRYVDRLRAAYADDLDGRVDLCVYWHELARRQIAVGNSRRAVLLATQNIRGAFSRPVLERIADSGAIFFAYSDEDWINDGAAVRISIVGQDDGSETLLLLDGVSVPQINPNLTSGSHYISSATELVENAHTAFQGDIRNGPFDLTHDLGQQMLAQPTNVNGRPNSDVVFPFVNAHDLAQRPRGAYIIDFGQHMDRKEAAMYQDPWEHLRVHVKPYRETLDVESLRTTWWIHEAWRPGLRARINPLGRYIATPLTSKHRFYVWLESNVVPDATVVAIAREDNYAFGVLHSRVHETWALAQAPRLGVGNDPRYTHTQCFNTYPFPWPLDIAESELTEAQSEHHTTIAAAAHSFDQLRAAWLNPSGVNPVLLQERTMTDLYNRQPDWLSDAHEELDGAVFAAYGWPLDLSDEEILTRLLDLNAQRASEKQ